MSAQAKAFLESQDLAEPTVRPTGHWWHGYMVSCVTSSIEIAAARRGVRYIPAHEILAIKGATLDIPTSHGTVIPDQLFALRYTNGFRAFALEVDRGTEPKTATTARKSYSRSIAQYGDVFDRELHKSHYGLKANLLVLYVFNARKNEKRLLELFDRRSNTVRQSVLVKTLDFQPLSQRPDSSAFDSGWQRSQNVNVRLPFEPRYSSFVASR